VEQYLVSFVEYDVISIVELLFPKSILYYQWHFMRSSGYNFGSVWAQNMYCRIDIMGFECEYMDILGDRTSRIRIMMLEIVSD
jgi:hypothetical protein